VRRRSALRRGSIERVVGSVRRFLSYCVWQRFSPAAQTRCAAQPEPLFTKNWGLAMGRTAKPERPWLGSSRQGSHSQQDYRRRDRHSDPRRKKGPKAKPKAGVQRHPLQERSRNWWITSRPCENSHVGLMISHRPGQETSSGGQSACAWPLFLDLPRICAPSREWT